MADILDLGRCSEPKRGAIEARPQIEVAFALRPPGRLLSSRESANYSRDALESLLAMLAGFPEVTEVNLLAHSMGNWVALEALRGRSMRGGQTPNSVKADKLKNAMLVAPDVDVDVFRMQIQRMGAAKTAHRIVRFSR